MDNTHGHDNYDLVNGVERVEITNRINSFADEKISGFEFLICMLN